MGLTTYNLNIFAGDMTYTKTELVSKLEGICIYTSSHGLRRYATYVLSYLECMVFQINWGKGLGKHLMKGKYGLNIY